jgi:hypothetical protein
MLNPKEDTYLGQNDFKRKNRRVVNLLRINLAFVDLDIDRQENSTLTGHHDSDLDFLLDWHRNNFEPFPSAIIASGRGYHLKWYFENPIPSQALPRWNAVQNVLMEKYSEMGADRQAKDASRVLRVIGTTNSKNGAIATMIYPRPGIEMGMYDFESFAQEHLPYPRADIERWRAARAEKQKARLDKREGNPPASNLTVATLNWARLGDLRALMRLRQLANGGTVPEGQRMSHLFWQVNFLMLSKATSPQHMYPEAAILANEIDPSWAYRSQELGTVYHKAVSFSKGEEIEYKGRKYPALYTPKNDTLINLFEIGSAEMVWMKTIISKEEAKSRKKIRDEAWRRKESMRDREAYLETVRVGQEAQARANRERVEAWRREAGQVDKEAYLETVRTCSEISKRHAQELKEKGLSYRAIALEMGVSVASVNNYLKKL